MSHRPPAGSQPPQDSTSTGTLLLAMIGRVVPGEAVAPDTERDDRYARLLGGADAAGVLPARYSSLAVSGSMAGEIGRFLRRPDVTRVLLTARGVTAREQPDDQPGSLVPRTEVVSVRPTPLGARALFQIVLSAEGARVVAHRLQLDVGCPRPDSSGGEPLKPPNVRVTHALAQAAFSVSDDDISEYAALSGDRNPVHMSDEAARAAGFTGRVAHGMLVSDLAAQRIAEILGWDPLTLTEVFVRFSLPVYPDTPLRLRVRSTDDPDAVAFSVDSASGAALKQGFMRREGMPFR